MDEEIRDSMGSLSPARSSASSTQLAALDVKSLGEEFADLCSSEVIGKALVRLSSVFGEPFGRDRALMRAMANEWVEALGDMPAVSLDSAVAAWIKAEAKWPKPADLRRMARAHLDKRVDEAAEATGKHPRRIAPTEEMLKFAFKKSMLRLNPTWANFLDAIHPSYEHLFFSHAVMGEYAHEVKNLSKFEAEYIDGKWGDKLAEMFGRRVSLGKHWQPEPPRNQAHQLDAEEVARRAAVCLDARQQYGFGQ
jgi:hypothetical protein